MVAAVFMHLNHEKQWIYGSLLLTVAFFIVLMFVPLFTTMDTIGTPSHAGAAHGGAAAEQQGTDVSLRAFHLLFIALSVVLAAFFAAWAAGAVPARARRPATWSSAVVSLAAGARPGRVRRAFQRKTRNLDRCDPAADDRRCCAAPRAAWRARCASARAIRRWRRPSKCGVIADARRRRRRAGGLRGLHRHLARRARRATRLRRSARRRPGTDPQEGTASMLNYLGMPMQASTHAAEIDHMIGARPLADAGAVRRLGRVLPLRAVPVPQGRQSQGQLRRREGQDREGPRDRHRRRRNGPARCLRHSGLGDARQAISRRKAKPIVVRVVGEAVRVEHRTIRAPTAGSAAPTSSCVAPTTRSASTAPIPTRRTTSPRSTS